MYILIVGIIVSKYCCKWVDYVILFGPVDITFIITPAITFYTLRYHCRIIYLTFELFSTTNENTITQLYSASIKSGAFRETENAL